MATVVINGTVFVPSLNGSLVNGNDCTPAICSLNYAELLYIPSLGGNAAYLTIFAVLLCAQIVLLAWYRTWSFSVGLICGLLLEIIGYIGRLGLHADVFSFGYFVVYLVCLTIAPAFITASIYLCLSRLVIVYGENIARFESRTYTVVFVCCDVLSLLLQAAGGGIAASFSGGSATAQAGIDIMIAGLAFQVFSLAIFVLLAADFALAVRRARYSELNDRFSAMRASRLFQMFPWVLALATLTILIRCCFRVAELQDGFGGAVANNQSLFMGLEGPMIFVAIAAITILHPAVCFGGRDQWRSTSRAAQRGRQGQTPEPKEVELLGPSRKAESHLSVSDEA